VPLWLKLSSTLRRALKIFGWEHGEVDRYVRSIKVHYDAPIMFVELEMYGEGEQELGNIVHRPPMQALILAALYVGLADFRPLPFKALQN
jgi:hypothetical protein